MQSLLSFHSINHSRNKFYLANALTLGLYGAGYVVIQARVIGKQVGANLPGTGLSVLLTILTLGIYPCVMLSVIAYKIAPVTHSSLGHSVLAFNLASFLAAFISGGLFLIISVALWAQAAWLLVDASNNLAVG